jgi:hypothetical protein
MMIPSFRCLTNFSTDMLARGKTIKDIEGSRRRVFLNQSVKMDPDSKSKIKWSPNDHTFQKDGVETTVTQHYLDTYGIQLVSQCEPELSNSSSLSSN